MRLTLILIALGTSSILFAQNWTIEEVGNLPFATSNNAVTLAYQNGQPTIYSFTGIDTSLKYTGIHLKTGGVNLTTGVSKQYADVPDTSGKVAAGASTVGNKIFVIGGYHVLANGTELSSNKVHCFNPQTGNWEADRSPAPVAIDDHVQAVWRDSLIYVITGWSNTRNVPDVQIYDPSLDKWAVGTPVPNNGLYTAFGASGTIIGNTIYYLGGASMGVNFPSTFRLRIGEINPNIPSDIVWRDSLLSSQERYYRAGCTGIAGFPTWFGGSATTYNYDGLSYSTNTAVQPNDQTLLLLSSTEVLRVDNNQLPMDLRGVGELDKTTKILAGGMYTNREVSDKVIKCTWGYPLHTSQLKNFQIQAYPNPCTEVFYLTETSHIEVYSSSGLLVSTQTSDRIETSSWSSGTYHVAILKNGKSSWIQVVVQKE